MRDRSRKRAGEPESTSTMDDCVRVRDVCRCAREFDIAITAQSVMRTLICAKRESSSASYERTFSGSVWHFAETGDADSVAFVVGKDPRILYDRDQRGRTALHWAASAGHLDVVRFILRTDPDVARIPDDLGLVAADHAYLTSRGRVLDEILTFSTPYDLSDVIETCQRTCRVFSVVRTIQAKSSSAPMVDIPRTNDHAPAAAFWSKQPMMNRDAKSAMKGSRFHRKASTIKTMTRASAAKMGAVSKNVASATSSFSSVPIPKDLCWCAGNSVRREQKTTSATITIEELVDLLSCDSSNNAKDDVTDKLSTMFDEDKALEPSTELWVYKLTVAGDRRGVEWRGLRKRGGKQELVAFIAGTSFAVRVCGRNTRMLEIHSLYVHPRFRGKRLTPLLVQSMVLHGIDTGVQHAVHTHRRRLPVGRPIATLGFYWRPLHVSRLLECRRVRSRRASFEMQTDVVLRWTLPERPSKATFVRRRLKGRADARAVCRLYRSHIANTPGVELAADMSEEEIERRFLPNNTDQVQSHGLFCANTRELVGFVSFYTLSEMSRGMHLRACANLCVCASTLVVDQHTMLVELLHVARESGHDIIYSLNTAFADDRLLRSLRFRNEKESKIHYYVYNFECDPVLRPSEVGLILP